MEENKEVWMLYGCVDCDMCTYVERIDNLKHSRDEICPPCPVCGESGLIQVCPFTLTPEESAETDANDPQWLKDAQELYRNWPDNWREIPKPPPSRRKEFLDFVNGFNDQIE